VEKIYRDFKYFTTGGLMEIYEPHMTCIRSEIMPDGGFFFVYLVGAYDRWLYFPCVPADLEPLAEAEVPLLTWMQDFLPAYLVDTSRQTVEVIETLDPVRDSMPEPGACLSPHLRHRVD